MHYERERDKKQGKDKRNKDSFKAWADFLFTGKNRGKPYYRGNKQSQQGTRKKIQNKSKVGYIYRINEITKRGAK